MTVTFTPHISSSDGILTLTWTNNGNLTNPKPVKIRPLNTRLKPNGVTFTPSYSISSGVYTISWHNNGGLSNPEPTQIAPFTVEA